MTSRLIHFESQVLCNFFTACCVAAILLIGALSSPAAILPTADPDYPAGAPVFTLDPELYSPAQRGLAQARELRQTFQNPETFTVGEIVMSMDVTGGGVNAGLIVEIFEVDDVNASSFSPGTLIHSLTVPTTEALPGTNQRLGLTLTDADQFVLPQRDSGTEGYAIQFSNVDEAAAGSIFRHSNDGTEHYTFGRFYKEDGNPSGTGRDLGVALAPTEIPEPATWLIAILGVAAVGLRRLM